MNFEKNKCAICNENFNPNDDIVVCPDCGTPYHRECFSKVLKCVNEDKHNLNDYINNSTDVINDDNFEQNEVYQSSSSNSEDENICSNCKTVNPKECLFCEVCGNSLSCENNSQKIDNENKSEFSKNINFKNINGFMGNKDNPFDNPYGDLNPDDTIAGETVQDLTLFVGSNSRYFLNKFQIMDKNKNITFNWAAALLGPLYLAYRKNYISAILFFIFLKISEVFTYIVQFNSVKTLGGFDPNDLPNNVLIFLSSFVIINIIIRIILGLFFNKIYMKKAVKTIKKHKQNKQDKLKFSCELTKQGTVSLKLIFVFLIINILISFIAQYLFMFYLR